MADRDNRMRKCILAGSYTKPYLVRQVRRVLLKYHLDEVE